MVVPALNWKNPFHAYKEYLDEKRRKKRLKKYLDGRVPVSVGTKRSEANVSTTGGRHMWPGPNDVRTHSAAEVLDAYTALNQQARGPVKSRIPVPAAGVSPIPVPKGFRNAYAPKSPSRLRHVSFPTDTPSGTPTVIRPTTYPANE
ncbi:Protein of unknown function [Pyronema omphalodes CBS 100304]|uniref:Uncharacterized protein n=1 Tax=Pyronema omphalodes (strain CBS 100304) TaxID=1076935 RepID=U4KYD0_PYROM|nr:Protein of unknown function [Pyronema omphalodes CBS 100304]